MLEDINDPFQQVAKRPARPSHPEGHPSPSGGGRGRQSTPVAADEPVDGAAAAGDDRPSEKADPMIRFKTDPGPGEVSPPRWWASRRDGPRGIVPRPGAEDEDTYAGE